MPGAGDPVPMLKREGDPGACCGVDGLGAGAGADEPNANGELGAVLLVLEALGAGAGAGAAPKPKAPVLAPLEGALPPPNENAGDAPAPAAGAGGCDWPNPKPPLEAPPPNGVGVDVGAVAGAPKSGAEAAGRVGDSSIESPPPLLCCCCCGCGFAAPNAPPAPPVPPAPPNWKEGMLPPPPPNPNEGVDETVSLVLVGFASPPPKANDDLFSPADADAVAPPNENVGLSVLAGCEFPNKVVCEPPNANGGLDVLEEASVGFVDEAPKLNGLDGCTRRYVSLSV